MYALASVLFSFGGGVHTSCYFLIPVFIYHCKTFLVSKARTASMTRSTNRSLHVVRENATTCSGVCCGSLPGLDLLSKEGWAVSYLAVTKEQMSMGPLIVPLHFMLTAFALLAVKSHIFIGVRISWAITFEPLHKRTSFLVWRYILTISRSSFSIKVKVMCRKWLFTYFSLLFLCMWLQVIIKVKVTHQGQGQINVNVKSMLFLRRDALMRVVCIWIKRVLVGLYVWPCLDRKST